MARTELAAIDATRDGYTVAPATAATADGHSFTNNGRRVLIVENTGTTSATVEVPFGRGVDGQTIAPRVVTVPAGAVIMTAPWPPVYNQAPDSVIHLDYPSPADLVVDIVEFPGL